MNFLLRFLCLVLNIVNFAIATPVLWFKSRGIKAKLPPITDPLLKISATELAEKIRKKEILSEYICLLYIKRIKQVNPILNAIVDERFEIALRDARNVDAYLRTSPLSCEELEKIKPLLGVPLTVKESCSLAGLSLCGGTLGRLGIKADKDAEVIARLKSCGAIPLLVSNTPEICLSWESNNLVIGRTNNPYDITRTSSGSSGGEGALLGAGASLVGIGSDVAGSIRLPAMFNGVFGHKPTARIISIKGHYPYCVDQRYGDYFAIGPMTRYAKDLRLMTRIMANDTINKTLKLNEKVNLADINIYYMEQEGSSVFLPTVQDEIKMAVRKSVDYLRTKCHSTVMDYKFSELKNSCEIAGSTMYSLKDIPNLLKGENQNLFVELAKSVVGLSNYTFNLLIFYFLQFIYNTCVFNEGYLRKNDFLKQLFIAKLGNNGVFLYPTFTTSAFYHNASLFHLSSVSYLMIFNSLGLPATHIPCGLDKNGLPIGIQVVASPHQDRLCFAVAEELEKCFGGWTPPK